MTSGSGGIRNFLVMYVHGIPRHFDCEISLKAVHFCIRNSVCTSWLYSDSPWNYKYNKKLVEKIVHCTCSATAPISYPASLSNLPNGCQGHPRFYPPPDHPPITKPDSNCVRTRCSFLFNYWHGLT